MFLNSLLRSSNFIETFISIQNVINQAYSKLLPKASQPPPPTPQFLCQLSNISQCLEIEGQERVKGNQIILFVSNLSFLEQFTLTLWNPTIHSVVQHAHVPVSTDYTVRDPTGQTIATEVLEKSNHTIRSFLFYFQLIPISDPVQHIPGRTSMTQKQIIFKANLPALGFNTYYFEKKGEIDSLLVLRRKFSFCYS